jgi:energy-coupling factor transport system ATP-binding protein
MRYNSDLHQHGLTVVIITHDVSLAANYADRPLVMRAGRLALYGPPRELFADPAALRACYVTPPQITELALAFRNGAGASGPAIIRVDELVKDLL